MPVVHATIGHRPVVVGAVVIVVVIVMTVANGVSQKPGSRHPGDRQPRIDTDIARLRRGNGILPYRVAL